MYNVMDIRKHSRNVYSILLYLYNLGHLFLKNTGKYFLYFINILIYKRRN